MKNVVINPKDFSEMQRRNYFIKQGETELRVRNPSGRQLIKVSYDKNTDELSYKCKQRKMKDLSKVYIKTYPYGIIVNNFYVLDKELYDNCKVKQITKKGE